MQIFFHRRARSRVASRCLSAFSLAAVFCASPHCLADTAAVTPVAPDDVPGLLKQCAGLSNLTSTPENDLPPKARTQAYRAYGDCVANVKRGFQKWVDTQDVVSTTQQAMSAIPDLPDEARRSLIQLGAGAAPASSGAVVGATNQLTAATNTANTGAQQSANASNFLGFSWGLGAGYAFGRGPRRVTASVVNNVVRVSSDVTDGPRVFFETHYYPEQFTAKPGNFGWGPFAAVEAGSNNSSSSNAIAGFGLGLMGGWKTDGSAGFSLGVGYVWEGNVQTLGDGITANQPLPAGETQVRYKNRSAGALVIMLSRQFGSSSNSTSSNNSNSTPSK